MLKRSYIKLSAPSSKTSQQPLPNSSTTSPSNVSNSFFFIFLLTQSDLYVLDEGAESFIYDILKDWVGKKVHITIEEL